MSFLILYPSLSYPLSVKLLYLTSDVLEQGHVLVKLGTPRTSEKLNAHRFTHDFEGVRVFLAEETIEYGPMYVDELTGLSTDRRGVVHL